MAPGACGIGVKPTLNHAAGIGSIGLKVGGEMEFIERPGPPDWVERRLAAILAADMAGYTRLIQRDILCPRGRR